MEYYLLPILGLLLLYIISTFIINHLKTKMVYDEIEAFCTKKGFTYSLSKDRRYDINITTESFTMFIRLCSIPKNSSVTVNSKTTWCLRYGGKRAGRSYPNKKYLNELIPFLNGNFTSDNKTYRVVLLIPSTEVVLKYINESDIMILKPEHTAYGYKAISYDKFESEFENILK